MSIKAKINALRSKTTAAGCTEAEALAAAEMAARMMAEHQLTDDDLSISETRTNSIKTLPRWRRSLLSAVARATNCAPLQVESENSFVMFYGRAPGPEIAAYLHDICIGACKTELANFRKGDFYKRRRTQKTKTIACADFLTAMADRLADRVVERFRPMQNSEALKQAVAVRNNANPHSTSLAIKGRKPRFSEAAVEGYFAGGRPALNEGVGASQTPKALT